MLPTQYNPKLFCSGAVNYAYYVADSIGIQEDAEALNLIALSKITLPMHEKTSTCKESLKRMICAEVYQPCVDNVVINDVTT